MADSTSLRQTSPRDHVSTSLDFGTIVTDASNQNQQALAGNSPSLPSPGQLRLQSSQALYGSWDRTFMVNSEDAICEGLLDDYHSPKTVKIVGGYFTAQLVTDRQGLYALRIVLPDKPAEITFSAVKGRKFLLQIKYEVESDDETHISGTLQWRNSHGPCKLKNWHLAKRHELGTCGICMEELIPHDNMSWCQDCGANFCTECITSWVYGVATAFTPESVPEDNEADCDNALPDSPPTPEIPPPRRTGGRFLPWLSGPRLQHRHLSDESSSRQRPASSGPRSGADDDSNAIEDGDVTIQDIAENTDEHPDSVNIPYTVNPSRLPGLDDLLPRGSVTPTLPEDRLMATEGTMEEEANGSPTAESMSSWGSQMDISDSPSLNGLSGRPRVENLESTARSAIEGRQLAATHEGDGSSLSPFSFSPIPQDESNLRTIQPHNGGQMNVEYQEDSDDSSFDFEPRFGPIRPPHLMTGQPPSGGQMNVDNQEDSDDSSLAFEPVRTSLSRPPRTSQPHASDRINTNTQVHGNWESNAIETMFGLFSPRRAESGRNSESPPSEPHHAPPPSPRTHVGGNGTPWDNFAEEPKKRCPNCNAQWKEWLCSCGDLPYTWIWLDQGMPDLARTDGRMERGFLSNW